ncbi:hypothetical protein EDD37DRAFT_663348 [Exophiala viscosa]|uniref:uncharacterized protein n=1 Tax=Exophiala viscosa TaxID=2486360 RepID=UPI0021931EB3|nr:hypothetical protein EDD37DRAFT_663348 [Exophiala viscosa]
MSYNPRHDDGDMGQITRHMPLVSADDNFQSKDSPGLFRRTIDSFAESFSDAITAVSASVDSDTDGPPNSNKGVHHSAQNHEEFTSTSKEPFLYQDPPSRSEDLGRKPTAILSSVPSGLGGIPQPLRPYTATKVFGFVLEFLICLLPIAFLVLAILARTFHGREISAYGENIKEWTIISPTFFPLVFAAVVGQSMRNIARYRLEQGCELKSVFGAIAPQVRLQFLDVAGLLLVLLWLISPLGGQASLRLLSTKASTNLTHSQIGYADPSAQNSGMVSDGFAVVDWASTINGIYVANLIAPLSVKQSPQDAWGNFKTVPDDDETDWASLLGLPVTGLQEGQRVNSTISSRYWYINCSQVYGVDGTVNWIPGVPEAFRLKFLNQTQVWLQGSTMSDTPNQWWVFFNGWELAADVPRSRSIKMAFVSWSGDGLSRFIVNPSSTSNVNIARCTLEPSRIDIKMTCEGFACRAVAARQSSIDGPPNASTDGYVEWWGPFFPTGNENAHDNIPTLYPSLRAQAAMDWSYNVAPQAAPSLNYMGGSEAFPFTGNAPMRLANLSGGEYYISEGLAPKLYELNPEDVVRRMRRLFNTYWQATIGSRAYNATIPQGSPAAFLSGQTANDCWNDYRMNISPSNATFEQDLIVYECEPWWFAITFIASFILLITGSQDSLRRSHALAPTCSTSSRLR